ncbi:type II/IV secretion system ATPase subunit [Hyperthermus butylicus]|uniref:Type II/IV secretion system protein n=1 Tax=Hyperthermus butylicus (strain DSM 5456 / JCM 9403 / PLM1-5) TaxID=415426 RepID=A2BLT1_HYPBU|nr:type II/IV secretion system ATPase subunit [Hyperthermus butylicus]ABM80942.1 putative Type II/IV secretion system protein [Hyperthermus butylicus DSM 5456]
MFLAKLLSKIKLRRHEEKKPEADFEEELEPLDYRRRTLSSVCPQKECEELESYPLEDPWVHAIILRNKRTGEIIYWIDEIPLSPEEKKIYDNIMDILYWELKPPTREDVDVFAYFAKEARKVVEVFQIRLGRTPGISWGKILYYVLRDAVGFGPIDPLMKDPNIEDISCNGVGRRVYVWHRRYEYIPTNLIFHSSEELDNLVVKLAHMAGKHVSVAFPIVDAILPGGHRLAATYKKEVTTGGSTFTIRKFREDPITIVDMIRFRTISAELAAYYWLLMEHKMPGMVLGVTGSGKTTTLNALLTLLKPSVKVVTIEDTPELKLPLENWVQLIPRMSYGLGMEKIGEISLYDLVRVSLRYRPDIIVVGEVRGEEAYVLFQAIATGHGGMTTLHAESIDAAVKRLTSPPMNIPEGYIPLMNFTLLIRRVEIIDPQTGRPKITRRITYTWEIADYGKYIVSHKWDARRDKHIVKLKDSVLMKRIMELHGWDKEYLLQEFNRRATVLKWMAAKNMRSYVEVARIIREYYMDPEGTHKIAIRDLGGEAEVEATEYQPGSLM